MMAPDFLARIDGAFRDGARAVQGRRVARTDTSFAILDACARRSTTIFQAGKQCTWPELCRHRSGMAFEFGMVKEILSRIDAVGGLTRYYSWRCEAGD